MVHYMVHYTGQVASARTDLLSQPYIDALVALQDSVPTISAERVAGWG